MLGAIGGGVTPVFGSCGRVGGVIGVGLLKIGAGGIEGAGGVGDKLNCGAGAGVGANTGEGFIGSGVIGAGAEIGGVGEGFIEGRLGVLGFE